LNLSETRNELERRKGERDRCRADRVACEERIRKLKKRLRSVERAQAAVQTVAQATQQQLEYRLSELASLALDSVFPEPYTLHIDFPVKRGATEARLYFTLPNSDEEIDPLDASGGGAVDIAAFALRIACWKLQQDKTRPILFLDEPFKNLNDPSRRLHEAAARMVKTVSDRLGLQIVMVTLLPELTEVADRTFNVKKVKGVSHVD